MIILIPTIKFNVTWSGMAVRKKEDLACLEGK